MKKSLFTAVAVGLGFTASLWAQVPSYVPTNGLVGWWPFNGNANDESGNGNNGTVNGATLTSDRFGNASEAYSFDGVDDFINVGNPIGLFNNPNSYSQSAWVFFFDTPANFGSYPVISKRHDNIGNDWATPVFRSTQNFWFFADDANYSGANYAMSSSISLGTWKHVIFVKENDAYKIYIDGVLDVSVIDNHIMSGSSNDLIFGAQLAWPQYLKGVIDDIGIWNRALTPQEISDLYNGTNVGLSEGNSFDEIQIYPNPASDHITIDNGNFTAMAGYSIKIENNAGHQVFQSAINQQQFYVDLSTWTGNGLYFVHLLDPQNNTVTVRKIVLQ